MVSDAQLERRDCALGWEVDVVLGLEEVRVLCGSTTLQLVSARWLAGRSDGGTG